MAHGVAWNSAARFAPLLAYYYALPQSVRASVSDAVLQELQSRRDTTDAEELRGIIWLSTWLAVSQPQKTRSNRPNLIDADAEWRAR